MREKLDYNSIKWSEHFYLDEYSESGLSRLKDLHFNIQGGGITHHANTIVGGKLYTKHGKPQCWQVHMLGKTYKAHRIIWVLLHGSIDANLVIDHLDGNPLNNKHNNLSLKTGRNNSQNRARNKNNTSGYTGVHFSSGTSKNGVIYSRWTATWKGVGGVQYLKSFSTFKYGNVVAMDMAILVRAKAIEALNLKGEMYTSRSTHEQ